MFQFRDFSNAVEGIYRCTMMNSSMMNESVKIDLVHPPLEEADQLIIELFHHFQSFFSLHRSSLH